MNSICYSTTSIYGTELTLDDRRKEFIDKNKTVCQDNCIFSDYDNNINKAICSCETQKSSNFFDDINIDTNLLYRNFMDINNMANIKILGCYKELLNKKGIIKNIGFYILIFIEIIHLINAIIFYYQDIKIIDDNINNINFAIKNWELVIKEEKERLEKMRAKKRKTIINNNIIHLTKKNTIIIKKENEENKHKKERIIRIPNLLDYHYMKANNLKSQIFEDIPNSPVKKKNKIINNSRNKNNSSVKEIGTIKNKKIIEKSKKIMEFNISELNDLEYKFALKYDHRTYCEYYLSLLKTKHTLIVIFFNDKDYNSRIIKLDLFFISFAISYAVNALFFNEETIHQINEDKGVFNFIYHIPKILYSCLISVVVNTILKLLALSESSIIKYKKDQKISSLNQRKSNLKRKLSIKFAIYFILGFIVLLFCWFYLTMFCAVYMNTQIYLIKDTLISFGLSLFYPFFIYLAPGIFRIPSLSDKKKQRSFLYSLSKILQFI